MTHHKSVLLLLLVLVIQVSPGVSNPTDPNYVNNVVNNFDVDALVQQFDTNKDSVISSAEQLQQREKIDEDNNGKITGCEFTTYARKYYKVPRFVAENLFDVLQEGNEEIRVQQTTQDLSAEKFKNNSLAELRQAATRLYLQVNGPLSGRQEVEVTYADVAKVIPRADVNNDGYIEDSDIIIARPNTRCYFVTTHTDSIYQVGSHWFFNRVFSIIDTNNDEMMYRVDVNHMIRDADKDGDGRATVAEFSDQVYAIFSQARWLGGVPFTHLRQCPTQPIQALTGNVDVWTSDIDFNKDGKITTQEFMFAIDFTDRDGDNEVTTKEFTRKAMFRYGVNRKEALELFHLFDLNKDNLLTKAADLGFIQLDINQDGVLSFCELRTAILKSLNTAHANSLKVSTL